MYFDPLLQTINTYSYSLWFKIHTSCQREQNRDITRWYIMETFFVDISGLYCPYSKHTNNNSMLKFDEDGKNTTKTKQTKKSSNKQTKLKQSPFTYLDNSASKKNLNLLWNAFPIYWHTKLFSLANTSRLKIIFLFTYIHLVKRKANDNCKWQQVVGFGYSLYMSFYTF